MALVIYNHRGTEYHLPICSALHLSWPVSKISLLGFSCFREEWVLCPEGYNHIRTQVDLEDKKNGSIRTTTEATYWILFQCFCTDVVGWNSIMPPFIRVWFDMKVSLVDCVYCRSSENRLHCGCHGHKSWCQQFLYLFIFMEHDSADEMKAEKHYTIARLSNNKCCRPKNRNPFHD